MARRKVRNYESVEVVRDKINKYFISHYDEVINYLLKRTQFNSIEDLSYAECHLNRFGFDCGWVWVGTFNEDQRREWRLDNGGWDNYVSRIQYPYNNQSTTCKRIQLDYALEALGMTDQYWAYVRLD